MINYWEIIYWKINYFSENRIYNINSIIKLNWFESNDKTNMRNITIIIQFTANIILDDVLHNRLTIYKI